MTNGELVLFGRRNLAAGASIVVGALALMSLALLNGTPFFFGDTDLHLALGRLLASPDPSPAIVPLQNDPALLGQPLPAHTRQYLLDAAASHLGARSVAYSIFLTSVTDFASVWAVAFIQCLFVSLSIWTFLQHVWRPVGPRDFLLLCAGLAAITPSAIAATTLIPDAFTAPLILLIASLFIASQRPGVFAGAMILSGICISAMVHLSHVSIAFLTGAGGALLFYLRARQTGEVLVRSALLIGALATSLILNALLARYAEHHIGTSLHRPPFILWRIVDDASGRAFLQHDCPTSGFEICRYAQRILAGGPIAGQYAMWALQAGIGGVYLVEDLAVRKRLRDEEWAFARAAISARPGQQLRASATNFAKLLGKFRMDGRGSSLTFTYDFYVNRKGWLGANERLKILPETCTRHPARPCGAVRQAGLVVTHYLTVAVAGALLLWFACRFVARNGFQLTRVDRIENALLLVPYAVAVNGLICGVLSGPFDRYQYRVIWLVPLIAAALLLYSNENSGLKKPFSASPLH